MSAIRRWAIPVLVLLAIVGGIVYVRTQQHGVTAKEALRDAAPDCRLVSQAFRQRESGNWLTLTATVERLLPDSDVQHTEQRFIVRCVDGQTVLIDNDVDIGERVPVQLNQRVALRGQFIWNGQGGLVHFTHHGGPAGGGWILFRGRVYS